MGTRSPEGEGCISLYMSACEGPWLCRHVSLSVSLGMGVYLRARVNVCL